MSIKTSQYSEISHAHGTAISYLERAQEVEGLSPELKEKLDNFLKDFKSYDLSQHKEKSKKLTGEILSKEEVLEIVKKATGFTKWEIGEEDDISVEELEDQYGVSLKTNEVKYYLVSRSCRSRDDIWLVHMKCMPGHVEIDFDTGRHGFGLDDLVTNEKALKEIKNQFEG